MNLYDYISVNIFGEIYRYVSLRREPLDFNGFSKKTRTMVV